MPPSLVTLLAGGVRKLYETPAIVALVRSLEYTQVPGLALIMHRYHDGATCSDTVQLVDACEEWIRLVSADEIGYSIEPFDLEVFVKTVAPRIANVILAGDMDAANDAALRRVKSTPVPDMFADMYERASGIKLHRPVFVSDIVPSGHDVSFPYRTA